MLNILIYITLQKPIILIMIMIIIILIYASAGLHDDSPENWVASEYIKEFPTNAFGRVDFINAESSRKPAKVKTG